MRKSINFIQSDETMTTCDVFRQRLKMVMAHDSVKASELAKKLGMQQQNLMHAINGSNISLTLAVKVAKAMDISLDWLCGLEENERN